MSGIDPRLPPEERVRLAVGRGPDASAAGRYGFLTKLARRIMGRAVKYERDYNHQIQLALLEKIQEVEASAAAAQSGALQDLSVRLSRLETSLVELQGHMRDVDARAALATTMSIGTADALREHDGDGAKARFVYDAVTATPYMAGDDMRLHDADGRTRIGYVGGGAAPVYAGFEDVFRGTPELVRERQRAYLDILADHGPVVDLGCGRGEMLQLLADAGIPAEGVDLDDAMVERSKATGVRAHRGEALEYLSKQEDGSLGAIFSAQFIEHLPTDKLSELLEVARVKLAPGGVFVAETVNPHSPRALKAFWVDVTHQHPLFPETMLVLCRLTGFEEGEIFFPLGGADLDVNLRTCGEYAVIARSHRNA
jgi:SAM-dependent methyltransferase